MLFIKCVAHTGGGEALIRNFIHLTVFMLSHPTEDMLRMLVLLLLITKNERNVTEKINIYKTCPDCLYVY